MGLNFGKLSKFLKRGLGASSKRSLLRTVPAMDEGQETRGLALLPLLRESRIREPPPPAPRAKSAKVLWVPGKKGLSEISGTLLESAIIYYLEDVCGV